MSKENLTKLYVDLPNHWVAASESMWAESLGNDLYRIRNVPFFAYGLNFYDVVRATSDSPDLNPEIREVVESSGHKTLRLIFNPVVDREKQVALLNELKKFKAGYERGDEINIAIDIQPDGLYDEVFDQLSNWEEDDLLSFETCEARIEGSFDDLPDEEDDS